MHYQRTVLNNGVRIITEELNHVRSVSVGFWFRAGSRHEASEQSGLSHLIEHMTFKGTSTRSAKEIAVAFDTIGGQVNAYTSKEYTCYFAKLLDQHFSKGVELLADMLLYSQYQPEMLEREKGVVLEEIKMYEDSPDELVHDLISQAVFDQHPLGRPILGSQETLTAFTRESLLEYRNQRYTPDNLVVAVVGNINHERVVEEISKYFGEWTGQGKQVVQELPFYHSNRLERIKEIEQAHICLGVKGISRIDDRKYALLILDNILGGGMSSRLFQELREERGLVYTTYTYHAAYHDTGVFGVYAGTSRENIPEVITIVQEQFSDILDNNLAIDELNRAKEQIKASLVLNLENTASRMGRLGKSELFGEKVKSPNELIELIDNITADAVVEIAKEILTQEYSTAMVLPKGGV